MKYKKNICKCRFGTGQYFIFWFFFNPFRFWGNYALNSIDVWFAMLMVHFLGRLSVCLLAASSVHSYSELCKKPLSIGIQYLGVNSCFCKDPPTLSCLT